MIVPFNRKFTDEDKDIELFSKLKSEMPGILNWAIEGLRRLEQQKFVFTKSAAMDRMMAIYLNSQNPVLQFFSDCIEIEKESKEFKDRILKAYHCWLDANGLEDYSSRSCQKFWKLYKLASQSNGLDFSDGKTKGDRFVRGIRLKDVPKSNLDINF